MEFDRVSNGVIGAAIEVHRHLGPGLLESAYEACLGFELARRGWNFERQMPVPLVYKEIRLDGAYRIDLLVEKTVVIEIKSVPVLAPVHDAQILTYLRIAGIRTGLLINFNVPVLRQGIKRFVL